MGKFLATIGEKIKRRILNKLSVIISSFIFEGYSQQLEEIGKMRETGLSNISVDESKKIKNALEQIRRLRLVGLEVPAEDEIEKLKQIRMIMGIAKLLTKEEELERIKDVSKEPLESVSEKIHNMEIQEDLEERIKKIEEELKIKTQYGQELKIYSLYLEGIDLLKKGAFKGAYRYFDKITEKDSNLKGAWLNKGVALGNLGKFDEEIVCYKIALRIDKNYKKALDNIKVAKESLGVQ